MHLYQLYQQTSASDSLKAGADPYTDFLWQNGLDFDGMIMTNTDSKRPRRKSSGYTVRSVFS